MKKYIQGFALLLITLSFNASAVQYCYPTSLNNWTCIDYYSLSNLGAFGPPVNNGMIMNSTSYNTASYAQKQAAEKAAKEAEKKAKEAKLRVCLDDAGNKNDALYDDISLRLTNQTADCQFAFAHEPGAMAACSKQAYDHYDGGLISLRAQLEVDKAWCEKQYGG